MVSWLPALRNPSDRVGRGGDVVKQLTVNNVLCKGGRSGRLRNEYAKG